MDAVLAILNNPLVLAAVGLVVKFVPGVRRVIANDVIGILTTLLAWLSQVVGPAEAAAMGGPLALGGPILAGGGFLGLGGLLGGLGGAVWQAAQAYLLHEMILRPLSPPRPHDSKRKLMTPKEAAK